MWAKPSPNQANLETQIMLAATFLDKTALNKLAKNLSKPLSNRASKVVFSVVRHWLELFANYSFSTQDNGGFARVEQLRISPELWFTGLQPETWAKLCEGKLPEEWNDLHCDRWPKRLN